VDILQIIIENTPDHDAGSGNAMNDKKIQNFDFDDLVTAFGMELAGNPGMAHWALTNALLAEHLGGSDTAARGGDLAYRYGLTGSLSDISFTPGIGILGASGFGSNPQALQSQGSCKTRPPRLN